MSNTLQYEGLVRYRSSDLISTLVSRVRPPRTALHYAISISSVDNNGYISATPAADTAAHRPQKRTIPVSQLQGPPPRPPPPMPQMWESTAAMAAAIMPQYMTQLPSKPVDNKLSLKKKQYVYCPLYFIG